MTSDYQVLGIAPGADAGEIKKAYARLLRKHTPDRDPEGFRRIREAYERIRQEDKQENGPAFAPFQTKLEEGFAKQIEEAKRTRNVALWRDTAQEAWDRFPQTFYFLYALTEAQRKAGNTGKAVKNAELLVKKDGENPWFLQALALAYDSRGYYKKGWPVFLKAAEKGARDVEFVLAFARVCENECMPDEILARDLLCELIEKDTFYQLEPETASRVYNYLTLFCEEETTEDHFQKGLETICQYIKKRGRDAKFHSQDWGRLLRQSCFLAQLGRGNAIRVDEAFQILKKKAVDPQETEDSRRICLMKLLEEDERSSSLLCYLASAVWEEKDKNLRRYAEVSRLLCALKERDQVLEGIVLFREEYPMFLDTLASVQPILEKDQEERETLQESLRKEFYRFTERGYEGSPYYKWYPQERDRFYGKVLASGEETFVRRQKKVGRNDPCPCGSGRKFKQCCMGKGIYD